MQKRWSQLFALFMSVPLLMMLLAACGAGTGTGTSTTTGTTTIEVATTLPVSGGDATDGLPTQDGAQLAVNEASIPGYKLVFVPKDYEGTNGTYDPAVGVQNVRELIGDAEVAGVVGPFNSSVAKADMPIANQAPIVMISPSTTNQCLTQVGAAVGCSGANDLVPTLRPTGKVTYFRTATTDDHQGGANADYLYQTQGYKNVYVLDDTTVYGVGIANTFSAEWKKLGGTVLGRTSEPITTTSFISLLTQIAADKPDVIYYGGTTADGLLKFRQQMEQVPGLKNTAMGGGDGIVDTSFASTIGTTGGPVYATVATSNVTNTTFINNYKSTFKQAPGAYSAAAYDCMNILINAIKKAIAGGAKPPTSSSDSAAATTFRQAVIDQVQKTDYTGLTGHITFDANGDTTNKVITIQKLESVANTPTWVIVKTLTLS